jgi:Holliday junction resolvase RusA-like endonuclease
MTLTVYGTPVPKGSARAFVIPGDKPRAVVVQNNKKPLAHWATQIGNEARRTAMIGDGGTRPMDFDGPFMVGATFFFNRPKSVSITARPVPSVKPDLDKLVRAVLDALTGIVWRDDAQVVSIIARKRYLSVASPEYVEIRVNPWAVEQAP